MGVCKETKKEIPLTASNAIIRHLQWSVSTTPGGAAWDLARFRIVVQYMFWNLCVFDVEVDLGNAKRPTEELQHWALPERMVEFFCCSL